VYTSRNGLDGMVAEYNNIHSFTKLSAVIIQSKRQYTHIFSVHATDVVTQQQLN